MAAQQEGRGAAGLGAEEVADGRGEVAGPCGPAGGRRTHRMPKGMRGSYASRPAATPTVVSSPAKQLPPIDRTPQMDDQAANPEDLLTVRDRPAAGQTV